MFAPPNLDGPMRMRQYALVLLLCPITLAHADDWPQWRGPNRDGVSRETGLLKEWPKEGLKLLWKAKDLGEGYSTPSVSAGRVYLMGTQGGKEHVLALDDKNGNLIWSKPAGTVGVNKGPQYPGPRSTPTVDGDVLYALASGGELVCMATSDGAVRWTKSLSGDLNGSPGKWAYSESPLVDGGLVLCTPGGKEATVAALRKTDGTVVWKTPIKGGDPAAYASPIVAEAGGVKQYVHFLQGGIIGVEARTGKFLWRYSETANKTANIPTPIFSDGFLFSATGYGTGGGMAKIEAGKADGEVVAVPIYKVKELVNQIGGFVRVGDHVYGTGSGGTLYCINFAKGNIVWKERSVGQGAVCAAEGHLYVRGEKGDVALVEATPEAYREKGRFSQPERSKRPAWPYPVVANGKLYLRDQGVMFCYDISAKK